MQNAGKIYLTPGRHPVISAIAPELASRFHLLTEPLPENITALLQRLDAKLSAEPSAMVQSAPAHGQIGMNPRRSVCFGGPGVET
jgi:hypothetical protein